MIIGTLTVLVWQLPHGSQLLYPLTILATYAHEMGHGLTALLVGAEFNRLVMFPDGSGFANWSGDVGRIARAMIAAGGLVGPSIAGASLLALSHRKELAKWILLLLGAVMLFSAVVVVRSLFGLLFVSAFGALFVVLSRASGGRWAPLTLQLVGVNLCLAIFKDVHYMFSEGGVIDGVKRMSDSAAIAEALFLPYWLWGALTALFSFVVLALGIYLAFRQQSKER